MKIKQLRDITIIEISNDMLIGISCDSCGGIGEKKCDSIKAPTFVVAQQTAKVVLAELISMGFTPTIVTNGLAVELEPTGKEIIRGFNDTISQLQYSNVHLTGSTEENALTCQTAMGVSAIGITQKSNLKYKKTTPTHICVVIGLPFLGMDLVNNQDKILSIHDYELLANSPFIEEIVPIGSKGIKYELNTLCSNNNINFNYAKNLSRDLTCSGGPSCSCLVSISQNHYKDLQKLINKPMDILGEFII